MNIIVVGCGRVGADLAQRLQSKGHQIVVVDNNPEAFWTAVAYSVPVTFLVLRNSEYAILKWFGSIEQVDGVPGLDLPKLDCAAIAEGYGVPSKRVSGREELREALTAAIATDGPKLVEVGVAPGMALF